MRTEQAKQARELSNGIKIARNEIHNLAARTDLSEWEQYQREFELCQAIDLLKSSLVDLVDLMLENDEVTKQLKVA